MRPFCKLIPASQLAGTPLAHCGHVCTHSFGKHINNMTTAVPACPPLLLWSLVFSQIRKPDSTVWFPVLVQRVHWGDMTGTLSFNQITIHNGWPCKYLMRVSHGANESETHAGRRPSFAKTVKEGWEGKNRKRSHRKCIYPIFMCHLNGSSV